MRALSFWLLPVLWLAFAPPARPADPITPSPSLDGTWSGEITAPNARTRFGLAFTRTERGLLVSVFFPEMFIYGVNFGPAEVREGTFRLAALDLTLRQHGDLLTGTFAPSALRVELHRGGEFSDEPPAAPHPAPPQPVWSVDLHSPAWASPAVWQQQIYVGTVDGNFHAVDATEGRELWTWKGPHALYGEAAVTEDAVYFVDANGELISLARATGLLRWRLPLRPPADTAGATPKDSTFNHRTPMPAIDSRGVLYVGSSDGGIYAVKARSGKKLWRHDAGAPIYATIGLGADDLTAACFDGTVVRLNRRTLKETLRTKLGGAIVSAPVTTGNRVVLGCRDYLLYGLDADTGAVAWRNSYWFSWVESTPRLDNGVLYVGGSDYRRVSAIDAVTGRRIWATDVGGLSWGTPYLTSSTVYAATAGQTIAGTVIKHTGAIVALDRATGTVKWRYGVEGATGADFTGFPGSVTGAAGRIIAAGVDGRLLAFAAE